MLFVVVQLQCCPRLLILLTVMICLDLRVHSFTSRCYNLRMSPMADVNASSMIGSGFVYLDLSISLSSIYLLPNIHSVL